LEPEDLSNKDLAALIKKLVHRGAITRVHTTPKGRETVAIQASVTKTSTFTGSGVDMPNHAKMAILYLDVTAASGTSPTLDVTIEMQDPTGTDYVEFTAFAQKTAALTAPAFIVVGLGAVAASITNEDDVAAVMLPQKIRAKATIGGTTPSFTYSVTAVVI